MKEQIIQLRSEGKTYRQIQKELNCSLSLVCYYCGINQKDKIQQRKRKYGNTLLSILKRKKDNFCCIKRTKGIDRRNPSPFTAKEFLEKVNSNPKCYLTGRSIDLFSPKTYHCDHIIPKSRGGTCQLSNMGLACKSANMAKGDMSLNEFLQLCKEILIYNGYDVKRIVK